jgi:NADPH:quinone reductase
MLGRTLDSKGKNLRLASRSSNDNLSGKYGDVPLLIDEVTVVTTSVICTALTGEDSLELQEQGSPPLSDDAVRIAVRASSVNFPDVLKIRGLYQQRLEPPFVPGSECAGEIIEVGPGVMGFSVGDRVLAVLGSGAFATEAIARPMHQQVRHIPAEMSFEEAASFAITYGTALNGLARRGGLVAGETVLITGASGGCGSAAIQISKAMGAKVIAVAGGDEKCQLAISLGADHVIDHRRVHSLSNAVSDLTEGKGVNVFFDTVGGEDLREQFRSLALFGRFLVIGFASGEIPIVKTNQTILKCISIVGVAYGVSTNAKPGEADEDFRQLFAWSREGLVQPSIGHRFALSEAGDALRMVSSRKALGKVVILMGAEGDLLCKA